MPHACKTSHYSCSQQSCKPEHCQTLVHRLTFGAGCEQKALPQKVVRVECNGLHAVLISRFLYDCSYFGKEVLAMLEAVVGTGTPQPPAACPLAYKPILEVTACACSCS